MKRMIEGNPFQITTPEDLTAEEAVNLFVDVFSDFSQITDSGHVILKGPRGVGKSMMFRFLQPDCQCLKCNVSISELPYLAVYIPLKNTNFMLTELRRFENKHASAILNEHLMVTHIISRVLDNLIDSNCFNGGYKLDEVYRFYVESFVPILGFEREEATNSTIDLLNRMLSQIKEVYNQTIKYIKSSAFSNDILPYTGFLYDYMDYLVPLLTSLSSALSNVSATFYLLLDDAHFLSETQTRILNTWVSSRTSRKVSLKISTQYNYKTYYTINGSTIDTPHDYLDIDMATVYTEGLKNPKGMYFGRISDIVRRRMNLFEISVPLESFFPPDKEQEEEISKIEEQYKERFDRGDGRGTNRSDDAIRYARPDYIKSLSGTKKSSSTYSYSGFDQLVNISSGVVRYFLQQAYSMYAKAKALNGNSRVLSIAPSIQNNVVREEANKYLFNDLEVLSKEGHEEAYPKDDIKKLFNLIQGLGGFFRKILLSNRSERRVFSIAVGDELTEDVAQVLDIGIQLGYFHKSTIGRKESGSIGRTRLFVLNRRLAPIWNLDPNGFAGYLFVKNRLLESFIENPFRTISNTPVEEDDSGQLYLFDSERDELTIVGDSDA